MRPSLRRPLLLSLLMLTAACGSGSGSDLPGTSPGTTSAIETPRASPELPSGEEPAAPSSPAEEPTVPAEEPTTPIESAEEPAAPAEPSTPVVTSPPPSETGGGTSTPVPSEADATCSALAALPTVQGTLTAWLGAAPIAPSGSEAFQEPGGTELAAFERAFRELLTSGPSAERASDFAQLGYALLSFTQTDGHPWLVLLEQPPLRGGGTFVINLAPARNLWLETPHADSDEGTLLQGARNLVALGARALLITGANRCATAAASPCSGTTSVCGTKGLRRSDAAHNSDNFFTAAHRALRDAYPDAVAVSVHGMDAPSDEAAVISDGTEVNRTGALSIRLRNAINKHLPATSPRTAFSCNSAKDTDKHSDLCGTTNVQGRIDNGAADACFADATTATDRFLHLEQAAALRGTGPSGTAVTQALADTVPCSLPGPGLDCAPVTAPIACR